MDIDLIANETFVRERIGAFVRQQLGEHIWDSDDLRSDSPDMAARLAELLGAEFDVTPQAAGLAEDQLHSIASAAALVSVVRAGRHSAPAAAVPNG